MSYILDALRKSEQQRQRGVAPSLFTAQIAADEVEKKPAFLFYGLIAAILICVGMLVGWLRPWQQQEQTVVAAKEPAGVSLAYEPPQTVPAPQPQQLPQPVPIEPQPIPPAPELARMPEPVLPPVEKSTPSIKPPPAPVANNAPKAASKKQEMPARLRAEAPTGRSQPDIPSTTMPKEVPTPAMDKDVSPARDKAFTAAVDKAATTLAMDNVVSPVVDKAATTPAVDKVATATTADKPVAMAVDKAMAPVNNGSAEALPKQEIIAMSALPPDIRQEIPTMSVSVHVFSSIPKKRLALINDRLLHEGEYLIPELRLEQITPDALVFSYKKYLFRHSL